MPGGMPAEEQAMTIRQMRAAIRKLEPQILAAFDRKDYAEWARLEGEANALTLAIRAAR